MGDNYSARLLLFSSYNDYPENTDADAENTIYPIAPFTEQSTFPHPILDSVVARQLMVRNITTRSGLIDQSVLLSRRPVASVTGRIRRIKHYYLALVTHSMILGQVDATEQNPDPEWYNINMYLDLSYRISM